MQSFREALTLMCLVWTAALVESVKACGGKSVLWDE